MREVHKVGEALQTHPLDRLSTRPMIEESLDAWLIRVHIPMTSHAKLQAGHAGGRRLMGRAMTIETVQTEPPGMELVAERDGLTILSGQV